MLPDCCFFAGLYCLLRPRQVLHIQVVHQLHLMHSLIQVVIFKSFSAFQVNAHIAGTGININTVALWIVFCKYCSHRIPSPYAIDH